MCTGKNGEYSLTRDVDEAFTRALADVSKPSVDLKDDGLTQFQAQSRLPDNVVILNDEELMKHLASVLFTRYATSPTEELADGIGELGGGLVSSDLRGITQALSTSSAWGAALTDCDGMTAVTGETKLAHSGIETACISSASADPHAYISGSTLSSFSNDTSVSLSSVPATCGLAQSAVALPVTATRQSVTASSLPSFTVAACSCTSIQRTSEATSVLSTAVDAGTSLLDSLLAAPVFQVGSLSALPQVLISSPASLLVSSPSTASLPSSGLPSLQTLPDVQTLMNPAWRYVVDSRPMATSSLSALPLASIFTPFSTAFCPPPPVSSSPVIKMDHPLASATVLATAAAASCSASTVCSPSMSDTAPSSLLPPVSVVHLTAGQAVVLPTCLSSSSAANCHEPLSGT